MDYFEIDKLMSHLLQLDRRVELFYVNKEKWNVVEVDSKLYKKGDSMHYELYIEKANEAMIIDSSMNKVEIEGSRTDLINNYWEEDNLFLNSIEEEEFYHNDNFNNQGLRDMHQDDPDWRWNID